MREIVGGMVAVVLIGGLLLVLGAIVRFSILSPIKTRGAKGRLRVPDPEGLEKLCGFAPPEALLTFYRTTPWVESAEFTLVDRSRTPPAEWFIYGFHPLSLRDVKEHRTITGVPGIPIASGDLDAYYVSRTGAVMVRSANRESGDREVAPDISAFAAFEIRQDPVDSE